MPQHLTPAEAAERLGITRQAVNAAIQRGALETCGRHGDVHKIAPAAVEAFRAIRERRLAQVDEVLGGGESPDAEKEI